jgi:4a-hydroxytetrahydrobiopterin dehydratase
MSDLSQQNCVPCRGGTPPLSPAEVEAALIDLAGWDVQVKDGVPRLMRTFIFMNFRDALAFADRVGLEAENQDHHPALLVEWGRVTVSWWTHRIGGLHQNDLIMAARTNRIFESQA